MHTLGCHQDNQDCKHSVTFKKDSASQVLFLFLKPALHRHTRASGYLSSSPASELRGGGSANALAGSGPSHTLAEATRRCAGNVALAKNASCSGVGSANDIQRWDIVLSPLQYSTRSNLRKLTKMCSDLHGRSGFEMSLLQRGQSRGEA